MSLRLARIVSNHESEGGPEESPGSHNVPQGAGPQVVRRISDNPPNSLPLRMYTEEEVSKMLQVSLSQLRKWRMKQNEQNAQGPPFKKIGRLVRYPAQALLDFINAK